MKVNQLRLGVIISYITILLSNIISIAVTPFMLRSLGQSEYGLYILIGSFVGYMAVLDFGLGNTITRYVAKYRAEKDRKGEENFLAVCLIIYSIISICVLLIGSIVYMTLQWSLSTSLTPEEVEKAKIMFVMLVANLVLCMSLNSFTAIMAGYEEFVMPGLLNVLRIVIKTIILVLLLLEGYKAIAMIVLDTTLNILVLLVSFIFVIKKLKIRIWVYHFDKAFIRKVFSFSFFVFLNMIADQIYWRLGQLVLGISAGTAAVAAFAIGMQFPNYYSQFSTAVSGVLLPRATQMVVGDASPEQMTDLMIKTGRIQFSILGYVLLGFIMYGKQFVAMWAGPDYSVSWTAAVIVMLPLTIPLFQNTGISILQAKNMHAFRSVMNLCISAINAGISVFLVRKYGVTGAAMGTALSIVMGNIVVINLYYQIKVRLNISRFFSELSKGLILAMIVSGGFGVLTLFIPGESWITFIVRGLLFSVAYITAMWSYGLNSYEKALVSSPVNQFRRKLQIIRES